MVKNKLYEIKEYNDELISQLQTVNLDFLKHKTLCVTGATGLLMSYFIDLILTSRIPCKIIALIRNVKSAKQRFSKFIKDKRFVIKKQDLLKKIALPVKKIDYVIHAASNSDQKNYAADPIGTMHTNYIGINNLLRFSVNKKVNTFLFTSSSEVYGDVAGNITETNYGNVNCLSLRSCYNESKRASETLGVCYAETYGIKFIAARLCRVYGPTMKMSDSKALSQFIKNAINGENVKLKSAGTQKLSYIYVSDAVKAIITLLQNGETKNAYNISNHKEQLTLREIAQIVAAEAKVRTEIIEMTEQEKKTYSEVKNAILSSEKLQLLGWTPQVLLPKGIKQTINIVNKIK